MSESFLAAVRARARDGGGEDAPGDFSADTLLLVFSHLSPADAARAAATCSAWADTARAEVLWRAFAIQALGAAGPAHAQHHAPRDRLLNVRDLVDRGYIASEAHFFGWQSEYRRIAADSARDHFTSREELCGRTFVYRRKRGDDRGIASSCFRFRSDGGVDGHPLLMPPVEAGDLRLTWFFVTEPELNLPDHPDGNCKCNAVIITAYGEPSVLLHASREPDWSWRLENKNVILTETPSSSVLPEPRGEEEQDALHRTRLGSIGMSQAALERASHLHDGGALYVQGGGHFVPDIREGGSASMLDEYALFLI